MEVIKERVTQVLDNKGVLSRLKAELRANVFLAINDQDIQQGGVGLAGKTDGMRREQLLRDPSGAVLVELVREFLQWCNLQFTLQVFAPEMQLADIAWERSSLQQKLGLAGSDGSKPLLMQLLSTYIEQQQQQQQQQAPPAPVAAVAAAVSSAGISANLPIKEQLTSAVNSAAAAPAAGAAAVTKQQPSKSGSLMEDIVDDDELINTNVAAEEEEEYAAVFLTAQARPSGLQQGDDSDGHSSTSSMTPRHHHGRPVRMQASTAAPHQQAEASVAAPDLSESFGNLDRSPAELSLELHGMNASEHMADTLAAAAGAGSPPSVFAGASTSSMISANSELPQHLAAALAAAPAAVAAAGRLGTLEPLAPLRPVKLAPLAPISKGPGSQLGSTSKGSPDSLREELRRAGLIGASPSTSADTDTASVNSSLAESNEQRPAYYTASSFVEQQGAGAQGRAAAAATVTAAAAAGGKAAVREQQQLDDDFRDGDSDVGMPAGLREAAAAAGVGTAALGAAAADDSTDEDDSDDFGIAEQRQLFEAARKQLSQNVAVQQQQQPASVAAGEVDGDEVVDSLDIPEDISLPLEGLEEEEEYDYSGMYNKAAAHTATSAAGAGAGVQLAQQLGMSMDLHDTGLSVSDRSIDIDHLPSTADFVIDNDDF